MKSIENSHSKSSYRKKVIISIIALLGCTSAGQASNYGEVVFKSTGDLMMEGAAKQVGGMILGQAMNSIFPPQEQPPSRTQLMSAIKESEQKILGSIEKLKNTVINEGQKNTLDNHLDRMRDIGATPVVTAISDYNPLLENPATPQSIQDKDAAIQRVISASRTYSSLLDVDMKIDTRASGYNGFWRSFGPYVSNKATNLAFLVEQWGAKHVQKGYKSNGELPLQVALDNVKNLENIYNHLEINVPTLPVMGEYGSRAKSPAQKNLNCVSRTDTDTQLFTKKGEFIPRYGSVTDVAKRLPNPTNYWRMYGHCRSNKFSTPAYPPGSKNLVYYGWKNVNTPAGKSIGPAKDLNACRLVVTFGQCQSKGSGYGCNTVPYSRDGYSDEGRRKIDPAITNEIGHGRGRTLYTKYLWNQEPRLPVASPSLNQYWTSGQLNGTFKAYTTIYENSVCANDPDGKNIAAQIPSAPDLPHLQNALFDTSKMVDWKNAPEAYKKNLPLTVIKVKSKGESGKNVYAYNFIKRNHKTKAPELSKPYLSPMSAAHDRSLHYFTEFDDYNLPTAYCEAASMVGIGHQILKGLKSKLSSKDITRVADRYRQVSRKLGITKENAIQRCGGNKINKHSPLHHIEVSLHDDMSRELDTKDQKFRSCMKVAAIKANKEHEKSKHATDALNAANKGCRVEHFGGQRKKRPGSNGGGIRQFVF
jgi:hypothetical protein